MTIQELNRYDDLRAECLALRTEIDRLKNAADKEHAFVHGSWNRYPYTERDFRVSGIGRKQSSRISALYLRLMQQEVELDARRMAIETWMGEIPDPRVRRIVRLKYVQGLTWCQVASRVYGRPCESAPRKYLSRYLE